MPVQVMGVLNVTPDSFSDGGSWLDVDDAVAHGLAMVEQGADVIDVGGESTRPGATPVGDDEECARVVPVLERLSVALRGSAVRLSVDTRHAVVARAAVDAGAGILNDVSASLHEVAAELGVAWVAMHMQGEPGTMQDDPTYDDVVAEVREALVAAARRAEQAGVPEVWLDPGIGFGKTFDHNWSLLANLDVLVDTGLPVVVGTSRKGFLGAALAEALGGDEAVPTGERLVGSLVTACWAATMGAAMLRVHDVADTVAALAHGQVARALVAGSTG